MLVGRMHKVRLEKETLDPRPKLFFVVLRSFKDSGLSAMLCWLEVCIM